MKSATWQDLGIVIEEDQPELRALLAELDVYLEAFLPPSERCWKCNTMQAGIIGALMGGFRWGLVNGEGECSTCGWPARVYHRDVGPFKWLSRLLQYRPKES